VEADAASIDEMVFWTRHDPSPPRGGSKMTAAFAPAKAPQRSLAAIAICLFTHRSCVSHPSQATPGDRCRA